MKNRIPIFQQPFLIPPSDKVLNHRRKSVSIALGLAIAVSAMLSGSLHAQESASQLFLAPSTVPDQDWTGASLLTLPTIGSYTFTATQAGGNDISDVQVLGELNPDPGSSDGSYDTADLDNISYSDESTYFDETPGISYSASTPGGTSDTVSFNQTGMYFVQVDTDQGSQQFQVDVDDYTMFDGSVQATGPQRIAGNLTPGNNINTIISTGAGDAALANATAQLPNAQTASTVQQVITASRLPMRPMATRRSPSP
jgi:hypothetical protein